MLKLADICIRDPFIVPVPQSRRYYLFGTTDANCWEPPATGFDVYESADLQNWSPPRAAFRPPTGFWADRHFWAPEVHCWQGRWYMLASFKAEDHCRGTQILTADDVAGPYRPYSDGPVTPPDWECLDGTLYVDDAEKPWMVFCHEWLQVHDGEICALPLTAELRPAGEPSLLFRASEAPWVLRAADQKNFITDGPFLYRCREGTLLMLWASSGPRGYAEGVARSESGHITGPWQHDPELLFADDGGHGMLFRTFAGDLMMTLHQPNIPRGEERARLLPLAECPGGGLRRL